MPTFFTHFLVFLDEGVDGLNDLAANLSMNENGVGGAIGAVGPGGTGKPRGTGNPGCANKAGCTNRTGLEDSIRSLSMNETNGAEGAIGASGIRVAKWDHGAEGAIGAGGIRVADWDKEVIGDGGTGGTFVAPYSGYLFPAYSSEVGKDNMPHA